MLPKPPYDPAPTETGFADLEQPKDFLEAQAAFANSPQAKATIPCPACRRSGQFVSRYTGRVVGPCYTCKGEGRTTPANLKRKATWKANEANGTHAAAQAAREQAKLARIAEFTQAHKAELEYLGARAERWDFAASLLKSFAEYGSLTENQLAAVERAMARDTERAKARETSKPSIPAANGLDLSKLPEGRYAVPNGDTRLKVLIQRPTPPSKWAGWIFVSDAAEYGERRKYGRQAPGAAYTGMIVEELRAIAADPKAASAAYGKLTGTCGVCGRHLEDAESVARGIGPICYSKVFGG